MYCPAYKVDRIVNTSGAGDAFCGGFLSGYLNGLPPEQAARFGNAAAHFILGGHGGHNSVADYEQVVKLIKDRDGIELSL